MILLEPDTNQVLLYKRHNVQNAGIPQCTCVHSHNCVWLRIKAVLCPATSSLPLKWGTQVLIHPYLHIGCIELAVSGQWGLPVLFAAERLHK